MLRCFIRSAVFALAALTGAGAAARAADAPLLLRDPTISRTHIAFVFGGAIWTVDRRGGPARRLVTGQAL
ncbi:MAG: hypothetical protein JOZ24_05470, partial [Candidatus Eremiobacteraeota bacterium]|nr:hypothetical protein [Candidatus Eremiobacteraeota bacterium]